MGLNVGPVIEEGGDYYGLAVNAAARIAGKARSDQVLVSEAVRAQASSGSDWTFVRPRAVLAQGVARAVASLRGDQRGGCDQASPDSRVGPVRRPGRRTGRPSSMRRPGERGQRRAGRRHRKRRRREDTPGRGGRCRGTAREVCGFSSGDATRPAVRDPYMPARGGSRGSPAASQPGSVSRPHRRARR